MIKIIDVTDEQLNKLKYFKFEEESMESTVHPFYYNGEKKVFKLFKEKININNKVAKMQLLNERLKNHKNVVTQEAFIKYNGKIIGYTMPFINGKLYNGLDFNRKQNISILKTISQYLKQLHASNIICGDFINNIIIDNNNIPILIDYDNFAIDNLKIDTKNIYLKNYEKVIKNIDYHFDNYLMNLFTLSIITKIHTIFLEEEYYSNPDYFNFKDKEIKEIVENTFNLNDTYSQHLIIDKIESKKDLKKIKLKIFK